jgi:peptidoglycan/xylan/chitin deacetylase (PgdA/CDA1 family)
VTEMSYRSAGPRLLAFSVAFTLLTGSCTTTPADVLPTPVLSPSATPSVTPSPTPSPIPSPTPRSTPRPTPSLRPPAEAAPLYCNGSRTVKVVALTIDDGYSNSAVLADLAILEREHVNATWFPIGEVVAANPDTWRTVAAAGFPIANHSWEHADLTRYAFAQVVGSIEHDRRAVSAIIGEPLLPVLRPMGGLWNPMVLEAAGAAGQRAVVLWDTTSGDSARTPGRSDIDLLVRNATRGTNGSIILMHANLPYTQQALPRIIAAYRARGFTFVTVGQLLGIRGPVPFPR